jgi:hypothetical protein
MDLQKKMSAQNKDVAANVRDLSHVKKYPTPEAFFEENQGKRFIVKGETAGLGFLDKSNVEALKNCSPPFILRYARDQIKVRRSLTSSKAIELIFSVYNLGFLYEQ